MGQLFLAHGTREYTYSQLLHDLNLKTESFSSIRIEKNKPYEIFVSILHSIVNGYPIELLDGEFTSEELAALGFDPVSAQGEHRLSERHAVSSMEELIQIMLAQTRWRLSLYTSGTTGRPKKVSHRLETLIRGVKRRDENKEDVWAFAYNPTHMAGLQVFFQAIMNRNPMVYVFDQPSTMFPGLLAKYRITNLSATSTFYRNIEPYIRELVYENVKGITFGGEKFDPKLQKQFGEIFPNARMRNIYASTEAGSLFASEGDTFLIPEELRPFVRISLDHELLLHCSLLGSSESLVLKDEWYHTGDIVEPVGSGRFTFSSRRSEMINVGGYKVNPNEVEMVLASIPGVVDSVVKSKVNSVTGQLIVAEVVKAEGFDSAELKKEIKRFASEHLQEWKVPRIITFVEAIPTTRTGKKARV